MDKTILFTFKGKQFLYLRNGQFNFIDQVTLPPYTYDHITDLMYTMVDSLGVPEINEEKLLDLFEQQLVRNINADGINGVDQCFARLFNKVPLKFRGQLLVFADAPALLEWLNWFVNLEPEFFINV